MNLTRVELYDRVCNLPLSKLAAEFSTSGTALAAICRKHRVPYPGSGYWTRKALGLQVELPLLPDGPEEEIDIPPAVSRPRKKRQRSQAPAPEANENAPDRRQTRRHPLLFGVEEHLRKTRAVKDGEFLRPYKRVLPDLISSENALPRLLSLAN